MLESIKKVYSLLPKGDGKKLALLFMMMLLASVLAVLGIGTVPVFVAVVIDPGRVLSYPLVGTFLDDVLDIRTPQRLVVFGAGLLILIYLFKNSYMVFYEYVKNNYMLNRMLVLQERLFNAYMRSPYTYFIARNSSELLRNVSSEVDKLINGCIKPSLTLTMHVTMTVVIVTGLLIVEPLITGVGMVLFGGGAFLFLKLTRSKVQYFGRESLEHRQGKNKAILQGLGGFKDSKVLNREAYFLKEFSHHADKHRYYDLWKNVINVLPTHLIELIALTGILFIAIVMVLQFRELNSIVTVLALFGAAIVKVKPSITIILNDVNVLRYSAYSVEAVYKDLKFLESREIHKIPVDRGAKPLSISSKIDLNNLSFSYPNADEQAVKDISLTIPKNHAVAFVGPSGAGKTTLVDVILGLLEPQQGTINVDGENVFEDMTAWQKNIGYNPQSIYLLDDTIRRNICFGIADKVIDDDRLMTAIETAQLGELVKDLRDGVDTIVGERGVRLSGGQRQRIGIARALYNNPQVLVMDEATSALDNVTEKYVIEAIDRLRGDKTIIMIAHRLTTVQNCDTIYMMKEGEIIASGTYDELLKNSREFRQMSLVDE